MTLLFQGKTAWKGSVQAFRLIGHETAERGYAWSYVTNEESGRRRLYAVLHQGPVDAAYKAVQAAMAGEQR